MFDWFRSYVPHVRRCEVWDCSRQATVEVFNKAWHLSMWVCWLHERIIHMQNQWVPDGSVEP